MKRKSSIIFFLLCCLLLLSACGEQAPVSGKEYSITEPYDFPPITDQPGWGHSSNDERIAACTVPEEILQEMSTRALIETLGQLTTRAIYCDMNNFPTNGYYNIHMDYLEESCNIVPELFSREDALTEMNHFCSENTGNTFGNALIWGLRSELKARTEAGSVPEQP